MKAMIFAAGLGTRLREITTSIPKALVTVGGRSVLERAVEYCAAGGFDDIIINVHHHAALVMDEVEKLRSEGYRIAISDESDELLETGGGLWKARYFFDEKPFLLYNVDIITDLDLMAFYRYFLNNPCLAAIAVRERPGKRFLLTDRSGYLRGWCNVETGEKKIPGKAGGELLKIANSSLHIADPGIFHYMKAGKYSLVDLYLSLAADHNIQTFRHDDGYWFDIGTPDSLEAARNYFGTISGKIE